MGWLGGAHYLRGGRVCIDLGGKVEEILKISWSNGWPVGERGNGVEPQGVIE